MRRRFWMGMCWNHRIYVRGGGDEMEGYQAGELIAASYKTEKIQKTAVKAPNFSLFIRFMKLFNCSIGKHRYL